MTDTNINLISLLLVVSEVCGYLRHSTIGSAQLSEKLGNAAQLVTEGLFKEVSQ